MSSCIKKEKRTITRYFIINRYNIPMRFYINICIKIFNHFYDNKKVYKREKIPI